ncbi:PadR family transcriptional regulator [Exilibacterium tricleocarpae]|uniref:PadR family transcriptional regulator n=1 Tax=Exilibacterium tricleocarpae TaxID=2591008 RepID=A0A545T686_9GAMM|nr:PadR family transcriptional regulator [Exilibacterium tricleocarpae]TQV72695.1 PadR family transcriptional regulator [Exilibacterium tricleocarpae]
MSLKHAILVMLETEPGSGYDLMRHFRQRLGYFWNAKHQQVYQQLKQLAIDGYIEYTLEAQADKPDKKVYSITPAGVEELRQWIAAPVAPNKINDPLLVKLYGGHLSDRDNLLAELERHIDTHRRRLQELEAIEQTLLSFDKAEQEAMKYPYITLRRGILGERAWLDWAAEAQQIINK